MTGGVSATEALLSVAAAVTGEERQTAFLALIGTGGAVVKPLDWSLLIAGDGSAGARLLAADRPGTWGHRPGPSAAIRSYRLRQPAEQLDAAAHADDARGRAVFADYVQAPGGDA